MGSDPSVQDIPDRLRRTPLYALHRELGARMSPFAGWDMPVQYPAGVLAEHRATRDRAGLFDVSHMGQALIEGPGAARALEALAPVDLAGLAEGRTRYTQFLNDAGGIIDDLMITRLPATEAGEDRLFLVVNAARTSVDLALLSALPTSARVQFLEDRALLALQGPRAAEALAAILPGVEAMAFMSMSERDWAGAGVFVGRSGYTGEDGYEISLPAHSAVALAQQLLRDGAVVPVGLGARDSLRLEAGLCLYGHDIDETTSPVEAALAWSIGKRRRAEGGFPGAQRIQNELRAGPARRRVGLELDGRQPAREGAEIVDGDTIVGRVTSGGFSPIRDRAIAMGYVAAAQARVGAQLALMVRGKPLLARVASLPFVPHRYVR